MNYWIFSVTNKKEDNKTYSGREIFDQRIKDGFWGLNENTSNKNNIQDKDKIVFYIGSPEMMLAGSATVKRRFYMQSDDEKERLSHGTNEVYRFDFGIIIDDISVWDKPIAIKEVLSELEFIRNKSNWNSYLQGGVTAITRNDFEYLSKINYMSQWPYMFEINEKYSRSDIFQILKIEDPRGGNWYTGYHHIENHWFIFCNVGTSGRTGHEYDNHFEGDELIWHGKTGSHKDQPSIKSITKNQDTFVYVFYREDNRDDFTFAGLAYAKEIMDTTPVGVRWSFKDSPEKGSEITPNEFTDSEEETVYEGAKKKITVNIYERNPSARNRCIEYWGCVCSICGFDFNEFYGKLGEGFIHVHHLIPISEIGEEYELNPISDLRPVCPNCHAMIHRRNPINSIEELKSILRNNNNS